MKNLYLKKGRDKSVRQFHPWIFSGAVERTEGDPENGDEVRVLSKDGDFLARGYFSGTTQICCRLLRWEDTPIDYDFWKYKISQSADLRVRHIAKDTNAFRMVNADGDGLPGLVVDKYKDVLVVQLNNAGMVKHKDEIAATLQELFSPDAIYEKSEGGGRTEEGLPKEIGMIAGEMPEGNIRIQENGLYFFVDVNHGQKSGFYLDQRDNRKLIRELANGKSVLDCFAYSGGFTVSALAGSAKSVVCVEASRQAIDLARRNVTENGFSLPEEALVVKNVFHYLRECQEKFDLIILDPPAFAKHRRDLKKASRAYKDVNMQAMKRLNPGGMLLTCSCSQHVSPELFQKIIFAAAMDAGIQAKIISERSHPPDHPISIYHPEGRYLHAFLLAVGE